MEKFLQPEEFNIDDIFKGKYEIPIYQRPYSWGVQQVGQLLNDIDDTFLEYQKGESTNIDDCVLFAGTVFIKTEKNVRNEYNEYTVVDGQQRITTFTLMLMCMLNHLYLISSEDDCVNEIKNYLWKKVERKNDKDKRVLTLGNIDKKIMIDLFDQLYSQKNIIDYANQLSLESTNEIEKNLLTNLLLINDHLEKKGTEEEYYAYIDFIKYNVKVISIKISTNMVKLFSIFESINSKGKPLEDIDLIKSYIFQNLSQNDYDEYLRKWGELIKRTNDRLNDYFTIFIRANVSYYKTSIKLENFKTLAENQLKKYYQTEVIDDVLKEFIDDMLANVKYYNMLTDTKLLENEGISSKTIVVFTMNRIAKYNHTEPLYFKLLSLRNHGLDNERFEKIVDYAFRFILTFQTISSRESKQTIRIFSDVQNEIYKLFETYYQDAVIDDDLVENILFIFNKTISDNAISNDNLRDSIRNTMTYKKNKEVVKILLSYMESFDNEGDVNYLILNAILNVGKNMHIDHILPQTPDSKDGSYKYYVVDDIVVLKDGQDFTADPKQERIPKEDFYNNYLHIIGNLRLAWANDNVRKSNHLIKLEEFDKSFNSYSDVNNRSKELIDKIIASNFLLSTDNIDFSPETLRKKRVVEVSAYQADGIEYKYYHPISFDIFDEKIELDKFTYQELLIEIFDILYDLEKDRLVEIAEDKFRPTGSRAYISNDKDDVREPYVLGNSVFVESNLSPQYMMLLFYEVIDAMGLDNKDLVIRLEEK